MPRDITETAELDPYRAREMLYRWEVGELQAVSFDDYKILSNECRHTNGLELEQIQNLRREGDDHRKQLE